MILHRPLDAVLRSHAHVAALRTLLDTTVGKSGSQVARDCGIHPLTALKALSGLEALGVVRRQRGGRDHLFTLRREKVLVRDLIIPLLESEHAFAGNVYAAITRSLPHTVLSLTIFGSTARREETPLSDLDLCCVVATAAEGAALREALHEHRDGLHERFNVMLSPIILTTAELFRRRKSPLILAIIEEGQVIAGRSILEIINDHTNNAKGRRLRRLSEIRRGSGALHERGKGRR